MGDNVDSWDEQAIRKLFKLDGTFASLSFTKTYESLSLTLILEGFYVGGKGTAEALVAVASIGGEGGVALSRRFRPSSPTVTYLVKALLEASPRQRRQLLSFVTSVQNFDRVGTLVQH